MLATLQRGTWINMVGLGTTLVGLQVPPAPPPPPHHLAEALCAPAAVAIVPFISIEYGLVPVAPEAHCPKSITEDLSGPVYSITKTRPF